MKTRRFFIYSVIYVCLVGAFIYTLDNSEHTFNLLDYSLTLPLAIWFMLPVALFSLLAVLHILYHSFSMYRYKRNIKKDGALYKEMTKEILLGLESNKEFKTDIYKIPAQILRILSPWNQNKDTSIEDAEINSVIQNVKSVQNGDVVDIKKFKLPKENPLNLKNEVNKVEKLSNYYAEILKNSSNADESLLKAVREKMIKTTSYQEIKRANFSLSADEIMLIVSRFVNDEIALEKDEIVELLNNVKITKEQYVKSAILLKDKLKPDAFIAVFEQLKTDHADAEEAYIYALYELQMIDKVRDAIEGSDNDEFKEIKTLLFLRDNGKIVSTSLFYK
ncbi:LapA family protein [Campylobacter sp. RM9344]|uniref:LapA family protein n=1 Tax=Campylobacter californiensis TaxID=1032243 RepID=A0AAW3ZQA4_9BACT|nr:MULTISPECIES: LapA family protein [unclassified Campylobacter]MBE2984396.1 LapA family protein [Campylobacter sp. RM6883]MBE2985734.1 LapA family protein [Campylobacter sp. RM12919]MBE2988746.1 LapA family protein [Campylobacter sp. RM12920]MBE2995831.1 LapA family protein [Campylobacter sp. RM6913]MBE3029662.1 LapA family protein [Campylobacter sp. RM9344]